MSFKKSILIQYIRILNNIIWIILNWILLGHLIYISLDQFQWIVFQHQNQFL